MRFRGFYWSIWDDTVVVFIHSYSLEISAAKGVDLTLWGFLGGLIGGIAGSASAFTYVVERKAVYREGQEIEGL
jgi:hypothetical protein